MNDGSEDAPASTVEAPEAEEAAAGETVTGEGAPEAGEPGAGATVTGEGAPEDTEVAEGTDGQGDATVTEPDDGAPRRTRRWLLPTLAGVVVVAVVAVVLLLVAQGSDAGSASDSFKRADREQRVGQADSGPRWDAVAGTWGVRDDAAYVSDPVSTGSSILVASTKLTDGSASTTLGHVVEGAGLLFDYRDADNYWELVAYPRVLSWQIYRVQQGRPAFVANTGSFSVVTDGTTIGIRRDGDRLEVLVDGMVRQRLHTPASGNRTGLVVSGAGSGVARWTNFTVDPA